MLHPVPGLYEQVVRWGVEAPAGTYALMCFPDYVPMWDVYRAAQLDVTGP